MNASAPHTDPQKPTRVVPIIRALWSSVRGGYMLYLKFPEPVVGQLWREESFWRWEVKNKHSTIGDRASSLHSAQENVETYIMALLRTKGKTRKWERG